MSAKTSLTFALPSIKPWIPLTSELEIALPTPWETLIATCSRSLSEFCESIINSCSLLWSCLNKLAKSILKASCSFLSLASIVAKFSWSSLFLSARFNNSCCCLSAAFAFMFATTSSWLNLILSSSRSRSFDALRKSISRCNCFAIRSPAANWSFNISSALRPRVLPLVVGTMLFWVVSRNCCCCCCCPLVAPAVTPLPRSIVSWTKPVTAETPPSRKSLIGFGIKL